MKFKIDFNPQFKKAFELIEKTTIITQAIQNKESLDIIYLKGNDEKSTRRIKPIDNL